MKKVILDNKLYKINNELFEQLCDREADCCAVCNDDTLRELEKACDKVKNQGIQIDIDYVITTPVLDEELPF